MKQYVKSKFMCWRLLPAIVILSACVSPPPADESEIPVVGRNRVPLDSSSPPELSPASRAVSDLLIGAQREYERGDWQAAIAVAERALRVDRRQPGIYLLIAKSYRALDELEQARRFVEQGLRYARDDDGATTRELNWLAEVLP